MSLLEKNRRSVSRNRFALALITLLVVPNLAERILAQDVLPQKEIAATPLAALVEEAKRNDPTILAAERAAKAATYAAPQVSTHPDPQFTLQHVSVGSPRPFAGYTNSDFAYIGIGASQQLPYLGKLKLRGAVADRDAATAKAHVEVVSEDEIEILKTTYVHLAYLQETLGILQRNATLLEQMEQQAEAQYSTGKGNQQDVLKAQLERTTIFREISMHHQLVGGTERRQADTRPRQSREPRVVPRGQQSRWPNLRHRQQRIVRWYPKSTPHLRIDFLGILLDEAVDANRLLMQMLQLAHMFKPRPLVGLGLGCHFVLDRFGDKRTQRNPARGGRRLGAAKYSIGNFQRGLHETMLPYLWEQVNQRLAAAEALYASFAEQPDT